MTLIENYYDIYLVKATVKTKHLELCQEVVWQNKKTSVKINTMLKKCKKDDKEGVYEVWIEEDYFSFAISHGTRKCARQILQHIVIEIVESEDTD